MSHSVSVCNLSCNVNNDLLSTLYLLYWLCSFIKFKLNPLCWLAFTPLHITDIYVSSFCLEFKTSNQIVNILVLYGFADSGFLIGNHWRHWVAIQLDEFLLLPRTLCATSERRLSYLVVLVVLLLYCCTVVQCYLPNTSCRRVAGLV